MLIRFVTSNFYSFGLEKEFNMLPSPRYRRLGHHKYDICSGFNVLKLSCIYGSNGAGKSNLIKSIAFLQNLVLKEELPVRMEQTKFKFRSISKNDAQVLAIEFLQDNIPFLYAIEIENGIIKTEELYISGLGKKADELIFERKTDNNKKTQIKFLKAFENDKESQVLKRVIEKNLAKPNRTILKLLTTLDNEFLTKIITAFEWFDNSLQILTPNSHPSAMAQRIDNNLEFKKFAQDTMCAFNIGIKSLSSEKKTLHAFFGEDNLEEIDTIKREFDESPDTIFGLRSKKGDELIFVKDDEDEQIYVKQLKLEHEISNGESAIFNLEEESDGTIRLLEFMPAFKEVISERKVFIIDEFERSIHPLLIKELLSKFSLDENTNGQLIFSTHESNLLDQNIFRQDEIWFAQKDKKGCTDLYSLSDFKEHNTIDIRKGYLTGRYGSIPFLANLHDLNWHQYEIEK